MARKGRSRKTGERFPNGKLRPVRDLGNVRVQAHRELYLRHGGIKATDDLDCALGQAHAAGDYIDYDENHTIRAWIAVLSYMLSDFRFIYE